MVASAGVRRFLPHDGADEGRSHGVECRCHHWVKCDAGIFDHCDNGVDHAVVLAGYGLDAKEEPYWLIQNSWGATLVGTGFVRMLRLQTWPMDRVASITRVPSAA